MGGDHRARLSRDCGPPLESCAATMASSSRKDGTCAFADVPFGSEMRMPGGEIAIVDREKLTGYCLNPEHPRGKHKARVFATALGFTAQNADELHTALLEAAATMDSQPARSDNYGDRYIIEFKIRGPRGAGVVRSTWIVRRGESVPRLTSCFVTEGERR